jgi:hypothetical protein
LSFSGSERCQWYFDFLAVLIFRRHRENRGGPLSGLDARLKKLHALKDAVVEDAPREEERRIPLQDLFDSPDLGEELLAAITAYDDARERALAAVEQARRDLLRRVKSEIGKEFRRVKEAEEKVADSCGSPQQIAALLSEMKPTLERSASSKDRIVAILEDIRGAVVPGGETAAAAGAASDAGPGTPVTGDSPGSPPSAEPPPGEGQPDDPSNASAEGPDEAPPAGGSKS